MDEDFAERFERVAGDKYLKCDKHGLGALVEALEMLAEYSHRHGHFCAEHDILYLSGDGSRMTVVTLGPVTEETYQSSQVPMRPLSHAEAPRGLTPRGKLVARGRNATDVSRVQPRALALSYPHVESCAVAGLEPASPDPCRSISGPPWRPSGSKALSY